ncbi:MAG: tRNA (adenosine(37)-N6)-dimethylallyltransferase MiaA [Flavobacteriaceae bacterium]|nr:tRNA (adenosine(37)-N6)-dimethylallyltransferase MiaA [Flavobacteriaceae bacterium]
MSFETPLLICVVGPTAIGKTTLSITLAKDFSAEIISADSRQFYKEMTIGTAVPSEKELAAATHNFIQNKSIFEDYSVGDFEREAITLLNELFKKHSIAIMVGGSGLYVDAVVNGLDHFPEVSETIRKKLIAEFEEHGILPLQEELKKVDPIYYNQVDVHNHQRVIRALEVYRGSGLPFSSFRKKKKTKRPFKTLYIGLRAEREVIYTRINERVDIMMQEGLLEEAQGLFRYKELNALQTVGYRELFDYFDGIISLDQAISEIKKNTRRFSKRQLTWFKKNPDIMWFDYDKPASEITAFIKKTLSQ